MSDQESGRKKPFEADPMGSPQTLTYTAVPPGSSQQMGVDRYEDLVLNRVDSCPAGSNGPGGSTCTAGDSGLLGAICDANLDCGAQSVCSMAQEDTDPNTVGDACELSIVPEPPPVGPFARGCPLFAGFARLFSIRVRYLEQRIVRLRTDDRECRASCLDEASGRLRSVSCTFPEGMTPRGRKKARA